MNHTDDDLDLESWLDGIIEGHRAKQNKTVAKIMKLLAKAEGTDNEAEAATFLAAAQRLMTEYAIAESMLRATDTARPADTVETRTIDLGATWWKTDLSLMSRIAKANCARAYGTPSIGRGYKSTVTVVGYPEDLDNVTRLYVSLQTQLARFLTGTPSAQTWRRAFRLGFAQRVGERLEAAHDDVVTEHADHTPDLLPVLADKATAVAAAMPTNLRTQTSRVSSAGYGHGRAAGDRADVGAGSRSLAGR